MANRARQDENFRQMLAGLDRGGVIDLVFTTIYDTATGERSYIDGDGNSVSQEQVDAQDAARAALAEMP